jgi:Na+/phosphate symporter
MTIMSDQALKDIRKDNYLMMHKVEQMLELTEDAFTKNRAQSLDQAAALGVEIKAMEDVLTEKLAKLGNTYPQARAVLPVPMYIEKIAMNIERIADGIRTKIKDGLLFSDRAILETGKLLAKGKEILKKTSELMVTGSAASADAVRKETDEMVAMATQYATAHEDRLIAGECSPKSSSIYLCMVYSFEDIASLIKDAVNRKMSGS